MSLNKVIKINEETGEVLSEYTYHDTKENLIEYRKENFSFKPYKPKSRFTKNYQDKDIIPKYSSKSLLCNYFLLQKHLSPELNMLGYLTHNGWKPYQKEDLEKVLQISRTTLARFLKESKDNNIIKEVMKENVTHFIMNPIYGFNGKYLNTFLYWVFQDCELFKQSLSEIDKENFENIVHNKLSKNL